MNDGAGHSERLKCFELVGVNDLTEPVEVLPCGDCDSWYVEVYRRDDGCLAVREWHDDYCYALRLLLLEFEARPVGGCDMSATVETMAAGRMTCETCGATATVDREKVAMIDRIAAFWDAHHSCGRIDIDLRPNREREAAAP